MQSTYTSGLPAFTNIIFKLNIIVAIYIHKWVASNRCLWTNLIYWSCNLHTQVGCQISISINLNRVGRLQSTYTSGLPDPTYLFALLLQEVAIYIHKWVASILPIELTTPLTSCNLHTQVGCQTRSTIKTIILNSCNLHTQVGCQIMMIS